MKLNTWVVTIDCGRDIEGDGKVNFQPVKREENMQYLQ